MIHHFLAASRLRRDQFWRYNHLSQPDKITGVVTHQVRGKNGVLLTPLELEKENLLFEPAHLVDIGGKFPFYEDYLAQLEGRQSTRDARDNNQIPLIGNKVPLSGDIGLLHTLWTRIGIHMNHREAFSPFDWESARLTVCHFPWTNL